MVQPFCSCGITRRGALRASLGAALGATIATGSAAAASPGLIDIHHHLSPPEYVTRIGRRTPLLPLVTGWTPEKSLADMDAAGVQTSILSITTPGLWFGDAAETKDVARACNEYAADLVRRYPGRFGSFATLPMPDVDASLAEIAYAMDTLGADGVMMFTSYGWWLGDPRAAPVLQELNRRRAVVYTHPTGPACCTNLIPGVPDTVVEYGTDTTRAITSLLFSGASQRYPDIRFIFSHAGGTAPFLMERFRFLAASPAQAARFGPGGTGSVDAEMKRFYYDTAQAFDPVTMAALRTMVPASQIVFGTDYPYRTAAEHVAGLAKLDLPAADLAAIGRGNAVRLLPRLV